MDTTTNVIAGFHRRGCAICRCQLVERHRLRLKHWDGEYKRGNVVRLCPTHHRLLHVLINWEYSQSVGQWKPFPRKESGLSKGERLHRLVGHIREKQKKLWRFYMVVQKPIVQWKIKSDRSPGIAIQYPDVFFLYDAWRAEYRKMITANSKRT